MKALTLTQPWATLLAIGAKRIETRSWSTAYRGQIAIHAAKGFPLAAQLICHVPPINTALIKAGINRVSDLPLGTVLAYARLDDILPITGPDLLPGARCVALDQEGIVRVWEPSELAGEKLHVGDVQLNEHEGAFGSYSPGRFAWLLSNVVKLNEPIPARGSRMLWEWSGNGLSHPLRSTGED